MRLASLLEGVVFMAGFLVLCFVVLMSTPLQPVPVRRAVTVPVRRRLPN